MSRNTVVELFETKIDLPYILYVDDITIDITLQYKSHSNCTFGMELVYFSSDASLNNFDVLAPSCDMQEQTEFPSVPTGSV